MLHWLGRACRAAREDAECKLRHVAVEADVGEGALRQFELGHQWPRDTDKTVAAYGRALEMDHLDLWDEALRLWRQER